MVSRHVVLIDGPLLSRRASERPGPSTAGSGELRVRQTAIGVNFHDVYVRSGQYRTLPLLGIPGIEAAWIVEEVGAGVSGFVAGVRIAYVTARYGVAPYRRGTADGAGMTLPLYRGSVQQVVEPNDAG